MVIFTEQSERRPVSVFCYAVAKPFTVNGDLHRTARKTACYSVANALSAIGDIYRSQKEACVRVLQRHGQRCLRQ